MAMIGRTAQFWLISRAAMASNVDNQSLGAYMADVKFRHFFAMMIAVAMLFAPFAMQSGSAMAAMPSDHYSQMMEKGHCGGQSNEGMADKVPGKSCCIAMCTAVAVTSVSRSEPLPFSQSVERPTLAQFHHGYLAELATPPPRRA